MIENWEGCCYKYIHRGSSNVQPATANAAGITGIAARFPAAGLYRNTSCSRRFPGREATRSHGPCTAEMQAAKWPTQARVTAQRYTTDGRACCLYTWP